MTGILERAYQDAVESLGGARLREAASAARKISEIELQARIFRGECGVEWHSEEGESVEVLHFGTWNREAGPDFCGAKIRLGGREVTGDVEVDLHDADWENHGHASNPAYANVILHVALRRSPRRFFARTCENRQVPQVFIVLKDEAVRQVRPREGAGKLEEDKARRLIEAAARVRLARKREAFLRAERLCGFEEALFQGLAVGLGYKNNKMPFLLVAERAGLARAQAADGESLLFGLAGFLTADDFDAGDGEARDYLRNLWDSWWLVRDREARLVLPPESWSYSGLRPANHPHRRMGALACMAAKFSRIAEAVREKSVEAFNETLHALEHSYWSRHASLAREPLPGKTALVGKERAADLAINAMLPAMTCDKAWPRWNALGVSSPSRKVLNAWEWLCGGEMAGVRYSATMQQGLLQLHEDFFRQDPGQVWQAFARGWTEADL